MPPTDDFDRFEWLSHLSNLLKEQGVIHRTIDESVAHIKKMCSLLEAGRIVEVFGEYDGSGDSGDMTVTFYREQKPLELQGAVTPPSGQREALSEQKCREYLTSGEKPLMTKEVFDGFMNDLWRMLPGGWEINDGSYGEVFVDVEDRTIKVDHNERYTDVNSSTHTY